MTMNNAVKQKILQLRGTGMKWKDIAEKISNNENIYYKLFSSIVDSI